MCLKCYYAIYRGILECTASHLLAVWSLQSTVVNIFVGSNSSYTINAHFQTNDPWEMYEPVYLPAIG